ncbi:MAG: hypothetical protein JWQ51_3397 [Tardiphaga sp.]|nr:hypothetical protein [Tardiphaga sp.]
MHGIVAGGEWAQISPCRTSGFNLRRRSGIANAISTGARPDVEGKIGIVEQVRRRPRSSMFQQRVGARDPPACRSHP